MNSRHQSIAAGECLVTKLTSELLKPGVDLTRTHVVLPTQRLHLYVTRELCRHSGGASLLPCLWTWDRFAKELIAEHMTKDLVMVSSQSDLIMEHVIKTRVKNANSNKTARPLNTNSRHAHELVHLAAELARSGLTDEAHGKITAWLEQDWRRSPEVFQAITERMTDVFEALNDFNQTMKTHQWTTSEAARSQAVADWLTASPELQTSLVPPGEIIIAGLTSLPGLENQLLAKLATHANISVWLDETPPHTETSPLTTLRKAIGLPLTPANQTLWAKGVKRITSTSDVSHEVMHTLTRVKDLTEQGIPPHEIAIIVPDETSHAPAFSALSGELGIAFNMPLASPWAETLPGRWLHLVTDLGRDANLHALGQYLRHPLTRSLFAAGPAYADHELQKQLKNFPESSHGLTAILKHLRSHRMIEVFPENDIVYMEKALLWCERFNGDTIEAAESELRRVIETPSKDKTKNPPKEQSAWKIFSDSVTLVSGLAPLRGYKPSGWKSFLSDIYRAAATESVRDTGEPLSGLQIIGLTEARYVPFAAAFIVGCVEGSFPHSLPKDSLIDNSMRRVMGISGWNELEALEDTTFHLLTSRLPHVEISYPHMDADSPKIRSRWIEQLAVKIPVTDVDSTAASSWLSGVAGTVTENLFEDATFEGLTSDHNAITSTASASRLRNLIWCPYRYLLGERNIETIELPEDRTSLTTGNLLHKVLERFFSPEPIKGLPPELEMDHCPADADSFVEWAHRRLDALAKITIPQSLARTPQFQHMTGKGWRQVAGFWGDLYRAGFSPKTVATEVSIGKSGELRIEINGRQIEIHGNIDAVHPDPRGSVLVDYKTSHTPSSATVADGLEPQLVLYALSLADDKQKTLARLKTTVDGAATAYFNLSEGKASFTAMGAGAKTLLTTHDVIAKQARPADLAASIDAVKNRWSGRLDAINTTSRFAADPSDCKFCQFSGVCRKDDPRYRQRIKQQTVAKAPREGASS